MHDRTRRRSRHASTLGVVLSLFVVACSTEEEPPPTRSDPTVGREIREEVTSEALESMTLEQIFQLGVRRLHWDPDGPPEGVPKAKLIEWYLEDEEIKDWGHWGYFGMDARSLEDQGYTDE